MVDTAAPTSGAASALHLTPPDARRAGLVVVGAERPELEALCAGFAEQGYEVRRAAPDAIATAVQALAAPVVVLALGEAAAAALTAAHSLPQIAALSLFDPPVGAFAKWLDRPAIAHFGQGEAASPEALDALRMLWPDLGVFPYAAPPDFIFGDSDAAHLARLRTLQLFHRAGGKPEMGG